MLPNMVNAERLVKQQVIEWRGYNHSLAIRDGELYDMENLSGDLYPVLSPRTGRRLVRTLAKPHGMCAAAEKLCWVDGTDFYFDGEVKGQVTDGDKRFARLGPYLLIFPDKAYYNTATDTFGALEASWSGRATFGNYTYDAEGGDAEAVYQGNALRTTGTAFPFEAGEAVEITGSSVSGNNKTSVIREIYDGGKTLVFSNDAFTEGGPESLTLRRTVPDMDYFCENENRLWGCHGNEIYACALGNPFRWHNLEGLATDSYAVTVGSDGDFTGAASYLGYAMFFKENAIHKVYGSKPSNFQVMTSAVGGTAAGAAPSLAVANETLFYLGRTGVMSYTGGVPVSIAGAFGGVRFSEGVGGSDGRKYYASLRSVDGWALFCYDALRGFWFREDNTQALAFAFAGRELHLLGADGAIYAMSGGTQADLPWMLDTGDMTESSPDKKGVTRLQMRMELDEGAAAAVEMQFDGDGVWHAVRTLSAARKRSYVLPLIPRRCDYYRIRVRGTGGARLYGLTREYYGGSEL